MSDALFSRLSRWADFAPGEAGAIHNMVGEVARVDRGDVLATDIRPGSAVIMLDCWAARTKEGPGGRRILTEFLLPGEVLQIDAFTGRTAATSVLSPGAIRIVPPSEFERLRADSKIGSALAWLAAIRKSIMSEWLVNIAARRAHRRLAHLLCELSVRLNAAGLFKDDASEMPITQVDLAAALAMSNVHLNIALQQLRSAGVVDLRDKRLAIRDRDHLEAIAYFDDGYLLQWPTRLPDRRSLLAQVRPEFERRRQHHYAG